MSTAIADTPAGRAILAAARAGTAGTPVYLRYAAEAAADRLLPHAAAAVAFASEVLGTPSSLYASAVRDERGRIVQLAISVRHPNDSVALLGIGTANGPRRPPTLLFLGDRGAVESNPGSPAYWKPLPEPGDDPGSQLVIDAIGRSLEGGRAEPLHAEGAVRNG